MEVEVAGTAAAPVVETPLQPLTLAEMRERQGGQDPKGTIGQEFLVTSNFMTINIDPKLTTLYQYSVDLEKLPAPGRNALSEKARRVRSGTGYRVLEKVGNEWFDPPTVLAYDGKNTAYSVSNLLNHGESREEDMALDERLRIRVKLSAPIALPVRAIYEYMRDELDTSRQDVLSALQSALNFNPRTRFRQVKKNGFYTQEGEVPMGGPITLWPGFKQGIKIGKGGLYLNISHSRTEMWKSITLDEVIKMCCHPDALRVGLNERDIFRFDALFNKLEVDPVHRDARKPMRIVGVSRVSAEEIRFQLKEGDPPISVADYFANHYNRSLLFPKLQCVDTGVPKKREIWTPMEVVKIRPGQHYRKPLTRKEQGERLKIENVKPHIMFGKLKYMYQHVNDDDKILNVFGLGVNPTFVQVKARQLVPPFLMYGLQNTPDGPRRLLLRPENGSWNMSGSTLYESNVDLEHWGVINFDHQFEVNKVQRFVQDLVSLARENGMRISNASPKIFLGDPNNPRHVFEDAVARCGGTNCQLMLVLKATDDQLYQNVKLESDKKYGFPSQVALTSKVGRGDTQSYRSNIALKMNMKLGSRNYILDTSYTEKLSGQKVMAIGLAISRGRQIGRNRGQKPFAAAVASMDSKMMHYRSRSCDLPPATDQIRRLDKMLKELLKEFRDMSNSYPETLLVFREGLTEGRWAVKNVERNVFHQEMKMIWKACGDLESGYKPKVVFIVVNKGNRARFMTDDRNYTDRSGNVKPGMVVDTQIVSSRYPEFYMISHVGLQGTARPCKYTVLWDELGMTMDELQEMCHNFCYTFARCTKAVSMVAPVYYASLMALREMLLSGQPVVGEEGAQNEGKAEPQANVDQPDGGSEPLGTCANPNLTTMFYV